MSSPPESRPTHFHVKNDFISAGVFKDGAFSKHPTLARGSVVLGCVAAAGEDSAGRTKRAVYTIGARAKPAVDDPAITFYALACSLEGRRDGRAGEVKDGGDGEDAAVHRQPLLHAAHAAEHPPRGERQRAQQSVQVAVSQDWPQSKV